MREGPYFRHLFGTWNVRMSLKFASGDALAQLCLQDLLLFRMLQLLIDMIVDHAPAETGYADAIPIFVPEYIHGDPKHMNTSCPYLLEFRTWYWYLYP